MVGDHLGEFGDPLAAARCELGEPVLLDLPLRVQAERLFDLDLHPQALAVEPVLVALVEALEGLVALEDVLQRPAPRVVDAHRVVGRDRAVEEAEALATAVLLAQLVEDAFAVPPGEDLLLQGGVVRDGREGLISHEAILRAKAPHLGGADQRRSRRLAGATVWNT